MRWLIWCGVAAMITVATGVRGDTCKDEERDATGHCPAKRQPPASPPASSPPSKQPTTSKLDISGDASVVGANIWLDHEDKGRAPSLLETTSGRHLLEVKRDTFDTFTLWVEVGAHETKQINVQLKATSAPSGIPAKLQKYSGIIRGINFKVGSDEILSSSNKVLDEAIRLLKEFPDIMVEIQSHTDDQDFNRPQSARIHNNLELSQARADTVKVYMVGNGIDENRLTAKGYGGTMPVDAPKGLTGAELQDTRTKNRRIEFKLGTAHK